ncbi:AMP-binding protein [Luteimonas sp. S4-F44]|uniref:AMP-binding protein n=1 Tax=Luteimonas sp. S4-F44 TaxID=2925842 RepID=UPI001F533EDF|nr:AMP-binding protein [Luteimonas sp. S4-F44]UNK43607.1 AMP-binding protein [Luteimonas sp. S4-F44]
MSVIHGEMQRYALTLDKFLAHAAKWHPDAEVVSARDGDGADRIGYAQLQQRSQQVSAVLAGLGVGHGDVVATLAWNTRAHVEVWYAVMGMGAVCHTLNPRLGDAQLVEMLDKSQARVLIVAHDLAPVAHRLAAQARAIERVLSIDGAAGEGGDAPAITPLYALLEAAGGAYAWGNFDEHAPCGLCFTSGTTGAPKGVTYTHRGNFLHTLRTLQADAMALSNRDSVLLAVPMFHANGWGVPFATPAVGARLVLPGRHLDGARLAALINAESVTVAVGIATVWLALVEHLEATGGQTPSLQRVVVGGAPLAPALMQRIEQRLGATVQTSWGMTELSPTGTVAAPDDPARAAHRAGRPAIGMDLLLTDADGVALPEQRDTEGHLRVRGASAIQRYFGDTRPAVDEAGWFPTGDLARIDRAGHLMITGRAKNLIKSGGEWINPAEIEEIVGAFPDVSLAAVIGREHPKWGERPVLLVEMREGSATTDAALLASLRARVVSWWVPDSVIRLARMPLAATGKIDRMRLRAEFGGAGGDPGA